MAKLTWNKKWKPPEWQIPQKPAADFGREYAELIKDVPGVLGVWTKVLDGALHIYTLIERDQAVESRVYEAQLRAFDGWPEDAPIRFRVYRDREALEQYVNPPEQILVHG